jgi:acetyl-CoA carboxylase biotin carboxyl carrier protein
VTLDEREAAEPAAMQPAAVQRPAAQPAATIDRLADDLLPALIARLDASDLGELEVRTDAWRVRLRKPFDRRRSAPLPEGRRRRHAPASPQRAVGHAADPPLQGAAGEDPASHDREGHAANPGGAPAASSEPAIATSPAVGYFSPRDGWTVGHRVRTGDVLGWVDCLGVRQEVMSPVDGNVGRMLAQPGEAVEYGQPLIHVDLSRVLAQTAAPSPRPSATAPGVLSATAPDAAPDAPPASQRVSEGA